MKSRLLRKTLAGAALPLVLVARALALGPDDLRQIAFEQKIGQQISSALIFRNSDGSNFRFGAHFGNRPTLLVLGYYHCPMLCALINNGLINALEELPLDVGKDFDVVNLSIDQRETAALAAAKKMEYLRAYGRPGAASGWYFLTGDKMSIQQIADETGFRFAYDAQSNEYAHPSGIIVLTLQGKISRYFPGVNFNAGELRQAIVAAEKGENGSIVQRLALLCYHYNPITGKYGVLIVSMLRGAGVVTVVAIGLLIFRCTRVVTPSPQSSQRFTRVRSREGDRAPGEDDCES